VELNAERCRALIAAHLEPGERLLHLGHGIERRRWTRVARLTSLLWRHYLIAATDRRVLLVEHGLGYREKGLESLRWDELETAALGWGVLVRPLLLASPSRGVRHRIEVPRLSSLDGNLLAAEGLVATWRTRQLPARVAAL
jgi:hypothetical protein